MFAQSTKILSVALAATLTLTPSTLAAPVGDASSIEERVAEVYYTLQPGETFCK